MVERLEVAAFLVFFLKKTFFLILMEKTTQKNKICFLHDFQMNPEFLIPPGMEAEVGGCDLNYPRKAGGQSPNCTRESPKTLRINVLDPEPQEGKKAHDPQKGLSVLDELIKKKLKTENQVVGCQ